MPSGSKIATVLWGFFVRFKNTVIKTSGPQIFVFIAYFDYYSFFVAHLRGLKDANNIKQASKNYNTRKLSITKSLSVYKRIPNHHWRHLVAL